jgi:hypothetical protein
MTLFSRLPHRLLGALGLTLACAFFASSFPYAAELQGTEVPLDAPDTLSVQLDTPGPQQQELAVPVPPSSVDAPPADEPPSPPASDKDERLANDSEHHSKWEMRNHQNWERDWEKNLSQAFGGNNDESSFHPALLIPLFAILFIFGGPIILLILILFFFFGAKRRRQQDINTNIDKLLAAGRDIPVELLRGDDPKGPEESGNLNKGIRNVFLGAGWLVFLTILFSIEIGAVGFIWIALGASQVLIWHLNKPNGTEQAGQQD